MCFTNPQTGVESKMNKAKPITAITMALIVIGTLLCSATHLIYAETLFVDDYESADFSAWTGTVNETDSTMQISSTEAYNGGYAANCSISNTLNTYAYAYCDFAGGMDILYHREYIRVSALPPSGAVLDLFGILDQVAIGKNLGTIAIGNNGTSCQWIIEYYNSTIEDSAEISTAVEIEANTWYYIEIMVKSGSLGTGEIAVWIAEDGISIEEVSPAINLTNIANDDLPIGTMFFGGYARGARYPVQILSDCVVASSTWTGPLDRTSPTAGTISADNQVAGEQVILSSTIADDAGVDFVVPSWNNTGTWINQTAIDASNSPSYSATFSSTWNSNSGDVVSVIFFANDTSNNWVKSDQYNFTLAAPTPTPTPTPSATPTPTPEPTSTPTPAPTATPSPTPSSFPTGALYAIAIIGVIFAVGIVAILVILKKVKPRNQKGI